MTGAFLAPNSGAPLLLRPLLCGRDQICRRFSGLARECVDRPGRDAPAVALLMCNPGRCPLAHGNKAARYGPGGSCCSGVAMSECSICGFARSADTPVVVGGLSLHLCWVCRTVVHSLERSGVLPHLPGCLFQIALEFEHEGEFCGGFQEVVFDRWQWRLNARLNAGQLIDACSCAMCTGLRDLKFDGVVEDDDTGEILCQGDNFVIFSDLPAHDFSRDFVKVPGGVFRVEDLGPGRAGDELEISILRSLPPEAVVMHRDGSRWRVADEIARRVVANAVRTRRGPVSPLAASATPFGPALVSTAELAARDARSSRYWRGLHLFGPEGYLDGLNWVDGDGVVHPVPEGH